jgi:hypothetical protein
LSIQARELKWMTSSFFQFCQLNRDLQIERNADGDIIIMALYVAP